MRKEIKVGDWVVWEGKDELLVKQGELYKVAEVDKSIVTVETKAGCLSAYYTNFSLYNPNELTVRELCEFIKKKGDGDVDYSIELYNDFSGGSRDGVIHFYSLEELTELVRNPNALRKEEIKKQIEELQNELNNL